MTANCANPCPKPNFMIDTHPTPANLAATTEDLMDELAAHIEAMIVIQMEAYPNGPNGWTEEERREMAMQHLGFMEDVA